MKYVKQNAELLVQDVSGNPNGVLVSPETIKEALKNEMYKFIEKCGRTCYKSEDKITETSARKFVDALISNGHTAMLEHGTVYMTVPTNDIQMMDSMQFDTYRNVSNSPYSTVGAVTDIDKEFVTTNFRVIVENNAMELMDEYLSIPCMYHERRYTVKFTCSRQVSHEFVRHRIFSFAQESTRYCNYSKDKFENELTFIEPYWYEESESFVKNDVDRYFEFADSLYQFMMEKGMKPQEAAAILPNALKTELVMTGFEDAWRYFFDLRYYGKTGKPLPQAKEVAEMAFNELKKTKTWE